MSTLPDGVELRRLTIPASLDAADAADFVAMADVRNVIRREITGDDDDRMTAAELLPYLGDDPDRILITWIVLQGGRAVGRADIAMPLQQGSTVGFFLVELLREVQGRGIGSAVLDVIERTAGEHGRTVLQTFVDHPAADGDHLASPTGFGEVPLDHAAQFLVHRGFVLEQVERTSAFDLDGDPARLRRLLADAEAASPEYRIVRWTVPTPAQFADGYAWMKSRMSTDIPAAGLEFDEEVWDAARVAREDAKTVAAGRTKHVTAAQHIATGELCAFNELVIGDDPHGTSRQHDTLVLADHRGHRLGMRVKCEGLLTWRRDHPDTHRLVTGNAEENRPMLDVNEAIGFVSISYMGGWKKVLR